MCLELVYLRLEQRRLGELCLAPTSRLAALCCCGITANSTCDVATWGWCTRQVRASPRSRRPPPVAIPQEECGAASPSPSSPSARPLCLLRANRTWWQGRPLRAARASSLRAPPRAVSASLTGAVPAGSPWVVEATLRSPPEWCAGLQGGLPTPSPPCPISCLQRPLAPSRVGTSISDLPDDLWVVAAPSGGCCSLQLRRNPLLQLSESGLPPDPRRVLCPFHLRDAIARRFR